MAVSNGQLGCGDLLTRISPHIVKFPVTVQVVRVALGNRFSVALDSGGRLWSWGACPSSCGGSLCWFALRVTFPFSSRVQVEAETVSWVSAH